VYRLNLNLRHAIISNVSGNSQDQLQDTIVDAIQSGEEKMLPGLGVLFEVIWKNANEQDKQEMLVTLEQGLKQ
jgi:small acid-soluble spore protein I (minor)